MMWAVHASRYELHLPFFAAVVVLLLSTSVFRCPMRRRISARINSSAFSASSWFDIEKSTATGFSIFAFLALNLPFVFPGFRGLVRSGLSLKTCANA